jgi:hypothetical protein
VTARVLEMARAGFNVRDHDGIMTEACDCFCDHKGGCPDGCLPADDEEPFRSDRWTCVGGTRYRLYDVRED